MTTTNIENMNDEEKLQLFLDLLGNGVEIDTAFITDEETGLVSHEIVILQCGDYTSVSEPTPLDMLLQSAGPSSKGATIN